MDSSDKSSFSYLWDLCVPLAVSVTPASVFMILGFVIGDMDKPGVKLERWQIVAIWVLQTVGMIAMAIVILTRTESAFKRLFLRTMHHPATWRRLSLILAMLLLLLFDILMNVGAAFAGAEPIMIAACPMFVAYLGFRLIAFAGLPADDLDQELLENDVLR